MRPSAAFRMGTSTCPVRFDNANHSRACARVDRNVSWSGSREVRSGGWTARNRQKRGTSDRTGVQFHDASPQGGIRIERDADDRGHHLGCQQMADNAVVIVFLNGNQREICRTMLAGQCPGRVGLAGVVPMRVGMARMRVLVREFGRDVRMTGRMGRSVMRVLMDVLVQVQCRPYGGRQSVHRQQNCT